MTATENAIEPGTDEQIVEEADVREHPKRPDWLPDTFESPEALAKAYKSAVVKITSQGQANAALRSENERLTAEVARLMDAREEFAERVSALERAYIARAAR